MAPSYKAPQSNLFVGTIVHVVDDDGSCTAAIVTRVLGVPPQTSKKPPSNPDISVHVFHPTGHLSSSYDVNPISYDEGNNPMTWHWPE